MRVRYRVEWVDNSDRPHAETLEGRGCYMQALALRDKVGGFVIRQELRPVPTWVDVGPVDDAPVVTHTRRARAKAARRGLTRGG